MTECRNDQVNEAIEFQAEQYADYLNFERGLSPLTACPPLPALHEQEASS